MAGVSIHYAAAQQAFEMASVKQIGSELVEMQKNVDDLQKNMGTLKAAKDELATAPTEGGAEIYKSDSGHGPIGTVQRTFASTPQLDTITLAIPLRIAQVRQDLVDLRRRILIEKLGQQDGLAESACAVHFNQEHL